MPVCRDYRFKIPPGKLPDWKPDGVPLSHFFSRPDFCPWQHDDRELLRRIDEIVVTPPILAQAA